MQGPASDSVVFKKVAPENASEALLSGQIDYYVDSLTPDEAMALKDNPAVKLYYAPSQINGLILNPAPSKDGQFNPFSLQEVRFALQYLIDRQGVVDSVDKGFGEPILTNLPSEHPSYALFKGAVDSLEISYDKTKAEEMIDAAMTAAGATKSNNVWSYNGKPIVLTVLIPAFNTDVKGVGEAAASALEGAGFAVNRTYLSRDQDSTMDVTDPADLKWNIGSTAWIYYGFSKYDGIAFPELYSKGGWWSYNNTGINAVNDQLKNISSEAQWEQLNGRLAQLYLNDSVGIWVSAKENVFAARSDVTGLTDDKFVGLRSYGNVRSAYRNGALVIGTGETYFQGDSWNPMVVEDINMMDIVNTMQDPITWSDPVTLEPEGFRANYTIETNGPEGQIEVPADAFNWNYTTKAWDAVGPDVKAKTKVTFDLSRYLGAKWHDGSMITWADVLYYTASLTDIALDSEKSKLFETAWGDTAKEIVGYKVEGNNLEVYLKIWSFNDDDLLVMDRIFQRIAPWELYAAMDKLVFADKTYAYYDDGTTDLPVLTLINGTVVQAVLDSLDSMNFSKGVSYVTAGGKAYLTEADFAARKVALNAWAQAHGHLLVSDGPFYLEKYNESDGSVELKAFRDPTYPFKKGELA